MVPTWSQDIFIIFKLVTTNLKGSGTTIYPVMDEVNQNISKNLELPPLSYTQHLKCMGMRQHTQLSKIYGTE